MAHLSHSMCIPRSQQTRHEYWKLRLASFLFLASYWNSTPTCSNFVTVAPPYSIFLCSAFPRACNRSSKTMMSCIRDGWKTTDCGFIFPHGGAFRQRPTTRQVYIYKTPYGVAGSSLTGSIPCRKVAASAAMPEFPAHQKPKHNPFNGLAIDARARADLKNPPTATQGGFVLIFKDSSGRLLRLRLSWF